MSVKCTRVEVENPGGGFMIFLSTVYAGDAGGDSWVLRYFIVGKTPWSSGKGEDSRPIGRGFESRPRCRDHLSCTINLDQKHESIIVE